MGESEKIGRFSCVDCGKNGCRKQNGDYPEFCEIPALTEEEIEKLRELYQDEEKSKSGDCHPRRLRESFTERTQELRRRLNLPAESEQRNSEL